MRIPRRVTAVLAVALAIAGSPVGAAAASVPSISSPGRWTLSRLGYSDIRLSTGQLTRTLHVGLPAGATQGPELWWQLFLHARVTFGRVATGHWYLTETVNGAASASIEFDLERSRPGELSWNEVNIDGEIRHTSPTRTVEFDFTNYIANDGIRPGPRPVTFEMERIGNVDGPPVPPRGFTSATIDARRTGFVWDKDGPDDLRLSVEPPKANPTVGSPFDVRYHVTNVGRAQRMSLRVMSSNGVRPHGGGNEVPLGVVGPARSSTIRLDAVRAGQQDILIGLANERGKIRSTQHLRLTVLPRKDRTALSLAVMVGAIVALTALVALIVWRRRPARGTR